MVHHRFFRSVCLLLAIAAGAAPGVAQYDLGPLKLPTQFAQLPYSNDFEASAGTVPPTMALTRFNAITLKFDAEAWCNIGQLGSCMTPFDGAYCLEMGLRPSSTNYHDVRNAMVLGLDGSGYSGSQTLSYLVTDYGDEWDLVDGVWLSNDGSLWYSIADWSLATSTWEEGQPAGLASTPVDVSGKFYLAFVQEDNFPFHDLDGIGIDKINIPAKVSGKSLGPLNLPTTFTPLPYDEGFEVAGGVVPDYMAVSALDTYTLQPDTNAWCNIGQRAACLDPFKGAYCLEMGADPSGTSNNFVRNALVIGLDGSNYGGQLDMSYFAANYGEEMDAVDGVWFSQDGSGWFPLRDWSGMVERVWTDSKPIDLSGVPIDLHTRFYLAFVEEDNSPFYGYDGLAIDEIHIPAKWVGVELGPLQVPYGYTVPPWVETFELAAGEVPGYLACTQLDAFDQPDPSAWCNLGQLSSCSNPHSGLYALEMGLAPGATAHIARNAMVMGVDPSFTTEPMTLSFMLYNAGDEYDPVDGVWISSNMNDWFMVQDFVGFSYNSWQYSGTVDLSITPVDVNQRFFLAFVQQDNLAYLASDGIGIDRIAIPALPAPPVLSVSNLNAGSTSSLTVTQAPSDSHCIFLASTIGAGTNYAQETELGLMPPVVQLGVEPTTSAGGAQLSSKVPNGLVGQTIWFQAVGVSQGLGVVSNVVSKRVN